MNNRAIDSSLSKLNSGFRINSAADDASGMAIADSLRSQASSLGKAIMNANDAIGIIQTADKAMDEQIKILETIKNKAIQSAQDGQTTETRKALQADISRLMEELDNIGNTTSFNGQKLLSGTFSNKEFQIGAYSNETVKASIGATTSDKIGLTRFETGHNVRAADLTGSVSVTFKNVDGINDVTIEKVQLTNGKGDTSATTGLGALAEAINKASDKTGIKASVTAQTVFEQPIKAGETTSNFSINGVKIGTVNVQEKDANGALRAAINAVKDQTGVEASVDAKGRLVLANRDGRGIKVEDNTTGAAPAKDFHNLVTQGAPGQENVKKAVDLNVAATWTTAAGAEGSIKNKDNTFADVKNAHGVQDAVIYGDGKQKAIDAVTAAAAANDVFDFTQFAADANGALNLGRNVAGSNQEVADLFDKFKAQTTLDGANSVIEDIEKALDKVINAADGKTMDTNAAQDGMIAHAFKQFFAGVKAGLNEADKTGMSSIVGMTTDNASNMGRLSLVANNGRDIQIDVKDANGFTTNSAVGYDKNVSEATVSLRETNSTISKKLADAMGFNANEWQAGDNGDNQNGYAAGVMTLKGAQAMMNIAETAQKALEAIRSDLGSVQNQLVSTVNNISVTQVNVKAAESNIRDVDFAEESATFSKHQILAQSGVYAMSQANAVQQNVMRLLQ